MKVTKLLTKVFLPLASLVGVAAGEGSNVPVTNGQVEIMPSLANGQAKAASMIPFYAQGLDLIDVLYILDYTVAAAVIIWCAVEMKVGGGFGHLVYELKGRHGMCAVIGSVVVLRAGLFALKYVFNMA